MPQIFFLIARTAAGQELPRRILLPNQLIASPFGHKSSQSSTYELLNHLEKQPLSDEAVGFQQNYITVQKNSSLVTTDI